MMGRPRTPVAPRRVASAGAPRAWRWAWAGAVCGVLVTLLGFAPAAWMAQALHGATGGRLILTQAQGSLWRGSALLELGAGGSAADRAALPGVLNWTLRPGLDGMHLKLNATCCTPQDVALRVAPQWGGFRVTVADAQSTWPAAVLAGLGTPWNTLQPTGELRLVTEGVDVRWVEGRPLLAGQMRLELLRLSSRLSTVRPLGNYRLQLSGGQTPRVNLETLEGSLRLVGDGQWVGSVLTFRGSASAEAGSEAALSNLLNIIGRRDGARSLITIG